MQSATSSEIFFMKTKELRNLAEGVIYGPVQSRRFGVSLGINLSGNGKYCSFNCRYCCRGFNDGRPDHPQFLQEILPVKEIINQVKIAMEKSEAGIVDWTVAGNGEPTDYPHFPQVIAELVELRNRYWPQIKLSALTNGMGTLDRVRSDAQQVIAALGKLDRPCVKLDSGVETTWRRLALPAYKVNLEEWLQGVSRLSRPIVQTMLLKGSIDNTGASELQALAQCYLRLAPREVHLYTINKIPADQRLLPVPEEARSQIEQLLHKYTAGSITSIVFYS